MSSIDNYYQSSTHSSLVGKILEQGQRLRNSMVQTILNNDPFNKEVTSNNYLKSDSKNLSKDRKEIRNKKHGHCCTTKNKFYENLQENYLYFSEEQALEELGILSNDSLLHSHYCKSCCCDICKEYSKVINPDENFKTDNKHAKKLDRQKNIPNIVVEKNVASDENIEKQKPESLSMLKTIKNTFQENLNLLKYVDSLKVNIHSLKLNVAGRRKIMSNNTENFSFENSVTYFIEYSLPDILTRNIPKSKAKVNSGLHQKNKVRFCSKKCQKETVFFKQQSIHNISNIELLDLSSINIQILISGRHIKQKLPEPFGKACFNLGSIITNQILTIEQDLPVVTEKVPVVLGYLKITLQFGCDKLHFGREFIDAINSHKPITDFPSGESIFKVLESDNTVLNTCKTIPTPYIVSNQNVENIVPQNSTRSYFEPYKEKSEVTTARENIHIPLLYAFVHISEAQITGDAENFFLVCYGLNNDDVTKSQTIYDSVNPIFNFYQLIPLLYDENFLGKLEDRYIVIEVWVKRQDREQLIGITKLSLHRFYVIYRNPQVVSHLFKNQNPIVGLDWWEPIIDVTNKTNCGQLKSLVAIGTESQINSLKQNIEIKNLTIKNRVDYLNNPIQTHNYHKDFKTSSQKRPDENIVYDKYVQTPDFDNISSNTNLRENFPVKNSVDVSTQSEISNMESENTKTTNTGRDFLNSFMEQVLSSKELVSKNVYVENSTNTEEITEKLNTTRSVTKSIANNEVINNSVKSDLPVKNTSDLLDSLQKALAYGNNSDNKINLENIDSFKAHIVIDSALHLPSRRKCKSKKNKLRGAKQSEEILPSTYVTFKNESGAEMIVTSVVAKNTSPKWDFRYDTHLPVELLLNSTKRLIFKVWRRSSATSLQPNFQTDVVLGFAALDLTVLLSGLPNVQGWFNIIDFSSKCNGQIKIHVTPLENISKFNKYKEIYSPKKPETNYEPVPIQEIKKTEKTDESPPEIFNRALKRKFTELEEITQRLKQRLSTITNDDSDMSDEFADEFERDLNTECIENEKINFENILQNLTPAKKNLEKSENTYAQIKVLDMINENCKEMEIGPQDNKSETSTLIEDEIKKDSTIKLDQHLLEGKLKIDSLLEKLSLLTENQKTEQRIDGLLEKLTLITDEENSEKSFSNRYVSGCSLDQEISEKKFLNNNPLLQQLNLDSNSLDPDLIFNPLLFQQIFTDSNEPTPRSEEFKNLHSTTLQSLIDSTSSSSTSMESFTDTNISRQAPDGEGIADAHLK